MLPPSLRRLLFVALTIVAGTPAGRGQGDTSFDSNPLPPEPFVVFFPPPAPAFGAPIGEPSIRRRNYVEGRLAVAPDELPEFVSENFYPVLSTRLFTQTLGKAFRERLVAYQQHRTTLLAELEGRLAEVRDAEPAARATALRELAARQAPDLARLEDEAEKLRHDLIHGRFLGGAYDWDYSRDWRIGDAAVTVDPHRSEAEFQAVRAAAFYADGLGVEQRGLLREMAIDLAREARRVRRLRQPAGDNPGAMFFAPATARFQLPDGLPPDLTATIARWNGEQAALRREVAQAVFDTDKLSAAKRAKQFAALTERQWPRIREQENLAEEIRTGLAAHRRDPSPWRPVLPPELRARIETYTHDAETLAADLRAGLARTSRINWNAPHNEREVRDQIQKEMAERQRAMMELQQRLRERREELRQRFEKIRADLALVAPGITDPRTKAPVTVDALLQALRVEQARYEQIGREEAMYTTYRTAMLEPGLSPAQRRLLFGAAHVNLAQPLPAAEVATRPLARPASISGSW